MPDWLWWVLAALVLAGVEVLTLDLWFVMLAGGALVGAGAAALGAPVSASVVAAGAAAIALVAFVRPVALRHLKVPHEIRTGVDALPGKEAVVLERVAGDADGGRIKLAGEIWSARAFDGTTTYEVGEHVHVLTIDGATALIG